MNEQEQRRMAEAVNRNFEDKEALVTVHAAGKQKQKKTYSNRDLTVLIRIMLATQAVLALGQLLLSLLLVSRLR